MTHLIDHACAVLAEKQRGLFSREQAYELGATEKQVRARVESGAWTVVLPGVYRLSGNADSWHQRLQALSLWAGAEGVIAFDAAAALHGMPGFGKPVEIAIPFDTKLDEAGYLVHRVHTLTPRDVMIREGLRVTKVPRTLLDLCVHHDAPRVQRAMDHCLRCKLTTVSTLDWFLNQLAPRKHKNSTVLVDIVSRYVTGEPPTESELEALTLEAIIAAGLALPVKQKVVGMAGGKVRRIDFAYPHLKIAIEAHGFAFHFDAARQEDDHLRRNALMGKRWLVFTVTWPMLKERATAEVFQEISEAVAKRTRIVEEYRARKTA